MKDSVQPKHTAVDAYISGLPAEKKRIMQLLRKTILEAAPESTEVISYNMPAVKMNRVLVYYAANKAHIGSIPRRPLLKRFSNS